MTNRIPETLTFIFAGAAALNGGAMICNVAQLHEARGAQTYIQRTCNSAQSADAQTICTELKDKSYRETFHAKAAAVDDLRNALISIALCGVAYGVSHRKANKAYDKKIKG